MALDLAGRRVLVTGAAGFLGRHLCRRLEGGGASVFAVSRSPRAGDDATTWFEGDLARLPDVERIWEAARPDVVFHLAGEVNGAPELSLLLPTFHSLVTSTVNLLAVAGERGRSRIVLMGSLEARGTEDAGAALSSPYAAAKTAATDYGLMCHRVFGMPVTVARIYMGYGPGQPEWKVIPATIRALLAGTPPRLSSGARTLDWIYVDDIADALARMATAAGIDGQTIDIGTGTLTSIREVVEHLVRLTGATVAPAFGTLPDTPARAPQTADLVRTERLLGWRPTLSLPEGLARTVSWWRLHRPAGS